MRYNKKQEEAINKLVIELFRSVGLYISNNRIFDQDTNLPWKFKNRYVKYGTLVVHHDEELFEPILCKPMIRDLFNIALAKNEEFNDMYIKSIYPIFDQKKKGLIINTDCESLHTHFYNLEVLIYYEACFILSNTLTEEIIDLLNYIDSFMIKIIPKSMKRKKAIFDGIYTKPTRNN